MQFKHSIFINSPDSYPYITKQQAWQGLLDRVLHQHLYSEGLDRCEIMNRDQWRTQSMLIRQLHYGSLQINDRVIIDERNHSIRIEIDATEDFASSFCDMTLTESAAQALAIHFYYVSLDKESAEEESYVTKLRQEAYKAADIDFVQQLRLRSYSSS